MGLVEGSNLQCDVVRHVGLESDNDWIMINVNGGHESGGISILVDVPMGHSASSVDLKVSGGDGWQKVDEPQEVICHQV